jgi:hypothetical protein
MSYKEFLQEICIRIQEKSAAGTKVVIREVTMTNIKRDGIIINDKKRTRICPILYLEDVYQRYRISGDMEGCIEEVMRRNRQYATEDTDCQEFLNDIFCWEKISGYIYPCLMSAEKNINALGNLEYRDYLDLVIFYMIKLPFGNKNNQAGIRITHDIAVQWGVGEETLYRIALQNMKKEGYSIESMETVLLELGKDSHNQEVMELLDEIKTEEIPETSGMYVMTNRNKMHGAAGMLDVEMLRDFAERHHSDFYIIPSSIHELIIVPDRENMDGAEIRQMVQDVNATELDEKDILSDNVYYYSRALRKVICLH